MITEGSSLTIYYLTDIGEDVTVECWDGSTAKTEAECPVRVECADGSFVHDKSDCKE